MTGFARLCPCEGGPTDLENAPDLIELDLLNEPGNRHIAASAGNALVALLGVLEQHGVGTDAELQTAEQQLLEALRTSPAARALLAAWLVRGDLRMWVTQDSGPAEFRLVTARQLPTHLVTLLRSLQADFESPARWHQVPADRPELEVVAP